MREIEVKIDESLQGKTVKEILFTDLKLTQGLVSSLKANDGIWVNDVKVTVRKIVRNKDVLKLILKPEKSDNIVPNNIPLDIIYEDEDILVVNKPYNMPTHPSKGHFEGTLANAVMYYYRDTKFKFRAVNRLDRDTTGIVLIAKNQYSAGVLNNQMINRDIKKQYKAICVGELKDKYGIIEAPIKRVDNSVIKRMVSPDGQYAKSEYWVLNSKDKFHLVKLKPHTGRTHQLRVHMSYIGAPIFGDFIYGEEVSGERTRLHCCSMEFYKPSDNKFISLEAPVPDDFFISEV